MSSRDSVAFRTRYPLRAIVAVAGAWLVFALQVFSGALFAILLLPLVPLFIVFVLSGAGLLASAHQYAASVARREPLPTKLAVRTDAQSSAKTRVAAATSA